VEFFRPRWNHALCGGTIVGSEALFTCGKCEKAAPAIGAVLPTGTRNEPEYFACHPELSVALLGWESVSKFRSDQRFKPTKKLSAGWLIRQLQTAEFRAGDG
jgi:hypothetical protein